MLALICCPAGGNSNCVPEEDGSVLVRDDLDALLQVRLSSLHLHVGLLHPGHAPFNPSGHVWHPNVRVSTNCTSSDVATLGDHTT